MQLGAPRAFWWGCFVLLPLFCGVDTRWLKGDAGDEALVIGEKQIGLDANLAELGLQDVPAQEAGEDLFKAMADFVDPATYSLSEHFATTDDGYILRLFRMHLKQGAAPDTSAEVAAASDPQDRPVVFLQHALLDSSIGWVMLGAGRAPAFTLADAGYDVWMGNVRGNRFSRNHTTLDPGTQPRFWSFSWDHHAQHDLPASIQAVIDATGADSLQYIGYSQGTMMMLGGLAYGDPVLTSRVSLAVLLAPVAFTSHITSSAFTGAARAKMAERLARYGFSEFGGHDPRSASVAHRVCSAFSYPCLKWLQLLCGANPQPGGNLAKSAVANLFTLMPAGTSIQNMAHWGQGVRAADDPLAVGPTMYDYGTACLAPDGAALPCNQAAYGQDAPPQYDLRTITTPVALFTGGHDTLSDPQDVLRLIDLLPDATLVHHTHIDEYAHLDFGVGEDAYQRLYPLVLQLLQQRGGVRASATHPTAAA